jgi:hypothetical protein
MRLAARMVMMNSLLKVMIAHLKCSDILMRLLKGIYKNRLSIKAAIQNDGAQVWIAPQILPSRRMTGQEPSLEKGALCIVVHYRRKKDRVSDNGLANSTVLLGLGFVRSI